MTSALRQIITELRQGAEMSAEGATSVQWRAGIQRLAPVSIQAHGAAVFVIASSARHLLLQRGQVSAPSDEALRPILVELANVLEMELAASEARHRNRQAARREIPHYLRDSA